MKKQTIRNIGVGLLVSIGTGYTLYTLMNRWKGKKAEQKKQEASLDFSNNMLDFPEQPEDENQERTYITLR